MDLCTRESTRLNDHSGHKPKESTPDRGQSKRRLHGSEPRQPKGRTKRKRVSKRVTDDQPSPESGPPTSEEADPKEEEEDGHCHSRKRHTLVEQKYRQRLNSQFNQLLAILPATPDDNNSHNRPPPLLQSAAAAAAAAAAATTATPFPQKHEKETSERNSNIQSTSSSSSTFPIHNHSSMSIIKPGLSLDTAAGGGVGRGGGGGDQRRVSKGEVLERARVYILSLEREHRRLVTERRELDLLWEGGGEVRGRGGGCYYGG
ncbi:hypothetical protein C8A00DRAFT_36608 [Chaetomidium leptoderma]|uniref:BHLH domain-containing protein n=1 Tax=Chaetomidium leptoderma TaxID=669021 RepID=A0AAN6VIH9_9PEZI|nr:hypothetical protein C8A00DRAFT_36608 [Chaetomidium leptoderma]